MMLSIRDALLFLPILILFQIQVSCTKAFPDSALLDLLAFQPVTPGTAPPPGVHGVVYSATSIFTTETPSTASSFNISLNTQPTAGSTVIFNLATGDAGEGLISLDGVTFGNTVALTFTDADWSVLQTVYVQGVEDALADGNIVYSIQSSIITSADPDYNGIDPADLSALNIDNDSGPVPGILITPASGLITREDGTTASFGVVLQSAPLSNVDIALSSGNTAEGTISPATLTFTTANWSTPQTVTVTGQNDFWQDGNVAYSILTAPSVSADPVYNTINASDVSVTNLDNDIIGIAVSVSALNTSENGGTALFSLALNSAPAADVVIGISSGDTTEGNVAPASLTFTTLNWNIAQNVTVTAVNDTVTDGDISYSIITAPAVSTDPQYGGLNPADVNVTNFDNDGGGTPGIHITPSSGLVTTEGGNIAQFGIVLQSQPSANVTVGLSSGDLTEGTVGVASVTFTPLNWSTPQTVTVTGADDLMQDTNIAYSIVTGAATSTDGNYNGIDPVDVALLNIDNDATGVTVSTGAASNITTEGGGTTSFTVVLNSQPSANVTLNVTIGDTSEGTVAAPFAGSAGTLTFTSANWNVPQTVTVAGVNDLLADGNIGYSVTFGTTASADPLYNGTFTPAAINLTNTDNDAPAGITVNTGTGPVTTESGGTATIWVSLNSQPTANVIVGGIGNITSSDLTEITVSSATLTFTTANWSTPQPITLSGVNDALPDGMINVTIGFGSATSADPGYSGMSPASVTAHNLDNEVAPGVIFLGSTSITTSETGTTAQVSVILNSQPDCASVTLSAITSQDLTEGTVSPASLTFTNVNWNVPRTITVTGVMDTVNDGDIIYSVTPGSTSGCTDPAWNGIVPATISVTNTNVFWPIMAYTRSAPAGAYASISATGNIITFVNSSDDDETTIPIGFNFTYLGIVYTNISIGTNGYGTFDTGFNYATATPYGSVASRANAYLFTTSRPKLVLAPWWDDMYMILPTSKAYYQVSGVAPNRVLTVEWLDNQYYYAWSTCGGTADVFNYQLKLYETSNVFEFVYGTKSGTTCGLDPPSASMGLSDEIGGDYHFQDAFSGTMNGYAAGVNDARSYANFPVSGTVIRYTP